MKYTLIFNDGVIYTSPNIMEKDPGWASENGSKTIGIRELRLNINPNKALILKGFEAYNFFVEASQSLCTKNGKASIKAFYFCGKWKGYVVVYCIDLKTGKMTKRISIDGKEYFGSVTRGWRMGLVGEKAESGIYLLK